MLLAFCAILTAAAACGGGGGDKKQSVPIEEMVAIYATTLCSIVDTCNGPAPVDFVGLSLSGSCAEEIQRTLEDSWLPLAKDAIARAAVIYHGDKVRECEAAMRSASCASLSNARIAVCEEIFEGTVDPGGACTLSDECKGENFCKVTGTCPGACTAAGREGAACDGGDEACAAGFVCDDDRCVAPVALDGACEEDGAPCADGTRCVGADPSTGTAGTCKEYASLFTAAPGETCNPQQGLYCREGSYCAVTSYSAGKPGYSCVGASPAGGSCKLAVPSACPAGTVCDVTFAQIARGDYDGTCAALPGEGAACVQYLVFKACGEGLSCVDDVCVRKARLEGACTDDDGCYSGNCASGACATKDPCT